MSKIKILILLTVVVATALMFAVSVYCQDSWNPGRKLNGNIEVSGIVTDPDGNPLQDVQLEAKEIWYTDSLNPDKFKQEREIQQKLDGNFRLSCGECNGFDVRFSKPGFFGRSYSWSLHREDGSVADSMVLPDVQVVLEKMPTPVQMTPLNGKFRIEDKGGPKNIVALGGKMPGTTVLSPQKTLENMQTPYIWLSAGRNSGSGFSHRDMAIPDRSGVTRPSPAHTMLHFSDPGDGLVLYSPKAPCNDTRLVYREMREAPESGYQNTVELDGAAPGCDLIFFYCKIGGRYGKGRILRPHFPSQDQKNEVVSAIYMRLNPDGSRNVTTWN